MVNKTEAHGHLMEFMNNLGVNPDLVRKVQIDPESITVILFAQKEDYEEGHEPRPKRKIGDNGRAVLTAIEFPLNNWEELV